MTTSKLEEVARALWAVQCKWDECGYDEEERKDIGMLMARAAIEAMREPNGRMSKAGRFYALDFHDGWVAAIDAALAEGEEG